MGTHVEVLPDDTDRLALLLLRGELRSIDMEQ